MIGEDVFTARWPFTRADPMPWLAGEELRLAAMVEWARLRSAPRMMRLNVTDSRCVTKRFILVPKP